MIHSLLAEAARWATNTISSLGYGGVTALMAIESACIPLPSEVIMPFSGYLVFLGKFNLHAASLAGALGCALGSVAAYVVGYWGGRPAVEKYGRYILLRRREFQKADRWFNNNGEWVVFVSRLLPIIRTFISLPAGIARMNFPRFLLYSFLGSVPWCYFLAYVGLLLGRNWHFIAKYFREADLLILGVLGLALLYALARRAKKAKTGDAGSQQ
jgi:membrane protein DedA with SNARE-associated domain